MTTIALWLLLGVPAPSPLPTAAPARPEPLVRAEREVAQSPSPERGPFLRTGVRVVAGGGASAEEPAPKGPSLP